MKSGFLDNSSIAELRKAISIMEWDMPNIRNDNLRAMKEFKLAQCKKELGMLLLKKNN